MPAVEVDSLVVRYGVLVAVDGVSLTAERGEVTVVLGANGAGKTSTIEVCEGYRRAAAGTVRVLGVDPARDQTQLSERMGVMLQEGGVYPSARVGETVRHYCRLYARGADPEALIDRLGLRDRERSTWRRLSGGERQRLSLALALAARPDVAFLDEPTSGVDVHGRDTIRAVVRELADDGCAVVLATHELDEAERIADRVVVFDRGRIVASGTLAALRGEPEIRFRTTPGLTIDLASRDVRELSPGEYVIAGASDALVVLQLTSWLHERGHPLSDVRTGAGRLEDAFRRLTTSTEPDLGTGRS